MFLQAECPSNSVKALKEPPMVDLSHGSHPLAQQPRPFI